MTSLNKEKPGQGIVSVLCPIIMCCEPLHMVLNFDIPILSNSRVLDLQHPINANTRTWEVVCEAGHVICLPADTAEDNYIFGTVLDHHDVIRLRNTTNTELFSHVYS